MKRCSGRGSQSKIVGILEKRREVENTIIGIQYAVHGYDTRKENASAVSLEKIMSLVNKDQVEVGVMFCEQT